MLSDLYERRNTIKMTVETLTRIQNENTLTPTQEEKVENALTRANNGLDRLETAIQNEEKKVVDSQIDNALNLLRNIDNV